MKDIKKDIRERWFENHIATLTQQGNLQVLDWRNPKCFSYHCRYVFDREFVYISGDLGEAVFRLTWNASIHSFDDIYSGYFHQKLSAFNEEKWDFNADNAVARLREWLKNLKEYGRKYDHDEMRQFFEETRECRSKSEWAYTINSHHDFLSELDQDLCEWMYSAGQEIPSRVQAYLIGLQMASEKIKAKVENYEKEKYPFGRCGKCGYEFNSELVNEYNIKYCLNCGEKFGDGGHES